MPRPTWTPRCKRAESSAAAAAVAAADQRRVARVAQAELPTGAQAEPRPEAQAGRRWLPKVGWAALPAVVPALRAVAARLEGEGRGRAQPVASPWARVARTEKVVSSNLAVSAVGGAEAAVWALAGYPRRAARRVRNPATVRCRSRQMGIVVPGRCCAPGATIPESSAEPRARAMRHAGPSPCQTRPARSILLVRPPPRMATRAPATAPSGACTPMAGTATAPNVASTRDAHPIVGPRARTMPTIAHQHPSFPPLVPRLFPTRARRAISVPAPCAGAPVT